MVEPHRTLEREGLGLLAGRIARELESILGSMLGCLSLAAALVPPGSLGAEELLNRAEKGALRAKNLTSQLSSFSDTREPVRRLTFLRKLIEDSCRFSLIGTEATCDFRIAADLWPVEIDRKQLVEVMICLVSNALQANLDRGEVVVGAENLELSGDNSLGLAEGSYVRILVRDSGGGIPEERLESILDVMNESSYGSFCLAMCNSVIERHDGIMVASSTPGLGSAFNVYLPASPDRAPAGTDAATDVSMVEGKVLVMDDDQGVQQVACEMLTHMGYSVTAVANGSAAVEAYSEAMASEEPFDFVVVDLTIPGGKGGLETLRELLEVDPDVRAIVSSGYFSDPAMFDFGAYGFCGILPKPYSLSDLRRLLTTLA